MGAVASVNVDEIVMGLQEKGVGCEITRPDGTTIQIKPDPKQQSEVRPAEQSGTPNRHPSPSLPDDGYSSYDNDLKLRDAFEKQNLHHLERHIPKLLDHRVKPDQLGSLTTDMLVKFLNFPLGDALSFTQVFGGDERQMVVSVDGVVDDKPKIKMPPMASLVEHEERINLVRNELGHVDEKYSFFISHYQAISSDMASILDLKLSMESGYPCWFDMTRTNITEEGMVQGVMQSAAFLLILVKGVFTRAWVVFEVRTAMALKKKIILVFEQDPRFGGYAPINEIFADAPDDIQKLMSIYEALPFRRKSYEQMAMVDEIVRNAAVPLLALGQVKEPLQVLDAEAYQRIRDRKKTSACFFDLGSGQTIIYLYALADDGSLDYQEVHKESENILTILDDPDLREAARKRMILGLRTIQARLDSIGHPHPIHMVKIGATAWLRHVEELKKKEKQTEESQNSQEHRNSVIEMSMAEQVEKWLIEVVKEAYSILPKIPRISFDTLRGSEEARLEWLAVRTATNAAFPSREAQAVLAGGKGSVQMSGNRTYISVDCILKEGTEFVLKKGWKAYQQEVEQTFNSFKPIGDSLSNSRYPRSKDRPLRLVIISAFYYVATAAGVVVGEKPDYIPCKDLTTKLETFLESKDGDPMDKANAVRLLHCLRVVTNEDPHLVEVLIIRTWTVRGKPYRTTWTTGAFINDLKEENARVIQLLKDKRNHENPL